MNADVIIPVYKPDFRLKILLDRIEKQTVQPERIIIINTEESYFNPEIVRGKERVEVHHISKEDFDHGGTRHEATKYSHADIMIFMTQDAVPKDRFLFWNLLEPLRDQKANVSYARQIPAPDCSALEAYTRQFNYPAKSKIKSMKDIDEMGIKTFFCSNVCAAYIRKDYDEAGGFIRKTIFNEDMILAGTMIKSGKKIAYAAEALVVHSHNYSGLMQLHRNFDLAVSQADHPEIFSGIVSEKEGIRMIKETAVYFLKKGKPWIIFELVYKSGCKYAGFLLGKHYKMLPKKLILKLTMNQSYWR